MRFFSRLAKIILATPWGQRLHKLYDDPHTSDDDVFDGCEISREEVYPDYEPKRA